MSSERGGTDGEKSAPFAELLTEGAKDLLAAQTEPVGSLAKFMEYTKDELPGKTAERAEQLSGYVHDRWPALAKLFTSPEDIREGARLYREGETRRREQLEASGKRDWSDQMIDGVRLMGKVENEPVGSLAKFMEYTKDELPGKTAERAEQLSRDIHDRWPALAKLFTSPEDIREGARIYREGETRRREQLEASGKRDWSDRSIDGVRLMGRVEKLVGLVKEVEELPKVLPTELLESALEAKDHTAEHAKKGSL